MFVIFKNEKYIFLKTQLEWFIYKQPYQQNT